MTAFIDWVGLFASKYDSLYSYLDSSRLRCGSHIFTIESNGKLICEDNLHIRGFVNEFGLKIQIPAKAFPESYSNGVGFKYDFQKVIKGFPDEMDVSRIDVATDYEDVNLLFKSKKSVKKKKVYVGEGKIESENYGGRGSDYIYMRVYDKGQQSERERLAAYRRFGSYDLRRVEFEIGRDWIVNFQIPKLKDLRACDPDLLFSWCVGQKGVEINSVGAERKAITSERLDFDAGLWAQALGCLKGIIGEFTGSKEDVQLLSRLTEIKRLLVEIKKGAKLEERDSESVGRCQRVWDRLRGKSPAR